MSVWDQAKGLSVSPATGKRRLHATALRMYRRCGEQFRRRYMEDEVRRPGLPMAIGSAVHKAAEVAMRTKRDEGEAAPEAEISEVAAATFRKIADAGGIAYTAEEQARGRVAADGRAMDDAVRLSVLHRRQIVPAVEPEIVEGRWALTMDAFPVDLSGVIDVVEVNGAVRDLKTESRRPGAFAAGNNEQLAFYAYARRAETGVLPPTMALDVLVKGATPTVEVRTATPTDDDMARLEARLERYVAGIEAAVFQPADPETDYWCSAKWCGYWSECPFATRGIGVVVPRGERPQRRRRRRGGTDGQ